MVRSPSRLVSCGRTTCRPGRSTSGNRLRKEGLTRQRPRVPHAFHAGGLAVLPVRRPLASTAHQVPGTHHRKSRWTGRRPEGKKLVTRQRFSCLRDCCQSARIRMTRSTPVRVVAAAATRTTVLWWGRRSGFRHWVGRCAA